MIKAVIFDMDGVLIDAKDWHFEALNKALHLFGFEINRYDHIKTYDGLPTKKKLEMFSLEHNLPQELHQFINEMKQLYTMEIIHSKCKPRFIHEYALSTLKSRGYKLAVASNSIRDTVEIMMQKAELDIYLESLLSNNDVLYAKPSPEIYLKAMESLSVLPHECLILEDNPNGVQAATNSKAHVMVIKDPNEVTFDNILRKITEIQKGNNN